MVFFSIYKSSKHKYNSSKQIMESSMQTMLSLFFPLCQPLFSIISAVPDAAEANTKQARKQAIQQQQNTQALMQVSDKTRSILSLLANGFSRPSSASSGLCSRASRMASSPLSASMTS